MNPDGTVTRPSKEKYHYMVDEDNDGDFDYVQKTDCPCFQMKQNKLKSYKNRVEKDDTINTLFKIFFYGIIIYLIYLLIQKMNNKSKSITSN